MKQTNTVKFQIQELLGIGMTLVVLGIGLAYGMQVMGDVRDDLDYCANAANLHNTSSGLCCVNTTVCTGANGGYGGTSAEYNATGQSIDAVAKIPEKLGTIVTVIVAAVIIGVLITYLYSRFQ